MPNCLKSLRNASISAMIASMIARIGLSSPIKSARTTSRTCRAMFKMEIKNSTMLESASAYAVRLTGIPTSTVFHCGSAIRPPRHASAY